MVCTCHSHLQLVNMGDGEHGRWGTLELGALSPLCHVGDNYTVYFTRLLSEVFHLLTNYSVAWMYVSSSVNIASLCYVMSFAVGSGATMSSEFGVQFLSLGYY